MGPWGPRGPRAHGAHGPMGPKPPGGGGPAVPAQIQNTIMLESGWLGAVPEIAHYPKPIKKTLTYGAGARSFGTTWTRAGPLWDHINTEGPWPGPFGFTWAEPARQLYTWQVGRQTSNLYKQPLRYHVSFVTSSSSLVFINKYIYIYIYITYMGVSRLFPYTNTVV